MGGRLIRQIKETFKYVEGLIKENFKYDWLSGECARVFWVLTYTIKCCIV